MQGTLVPIPYLAWRGNENGVGSRPSGLPHPVLLRLLL